MSDWPEDQDELLPGDAQREALEACEQCQGEGPMEKFRGLKGDVWLCTECWMEALENGGPRAEMENKR